MTALFAHTDLNNVTEFKKCNGETINILEKIGSDYEDFGTKLLSDSEGNIMSEIKNDCKEKAMAIKREIIRKWIRGTGKKPISWETLAGVLESMGLTVLAQHIRQGTQGIDLCDKMLLGSVLSRQLYVYVKCSQLLCAYGWNWHYICGIYTFLQLQ